MKKKLNWNFVQKVDTWKDTLIDDQGEVESSFYVYFKWLTLILLAWGAIDFCYETLYLWLICGKPVYPDQPTLQMIFSIMQLGYVYLCYAIYVKEELSIYGFIASIISLSFVIAHHVDDVCSPNHFWVRQLYDSVDWLYGIHSIVIIYRGLISFGRYNMKKAITFTSSFFMFWFVYFLHLEIIATFCLYNLNIPFCANFIRKMLGV